MGRTVMHTVLLFLLKCGIEGKSKWKYLPITKTEIIVTKAKNKEKQRYLQQEVTRDDNK